MISPGAAGDAQLVVACTDMTVNGIDGVVHNSRWHVHGVDRTFPCGYAPHSLTSTHLPLTGREEQQKKSNSRSLSAALSRNSHHHRES